MNRRIVLVVATTVAVLFGPQAGAQSPTPIRLVIGQTTTSQDGYFAIEGGLFKRYGLDVQISQMRGGAAEAAAVAGNAADIGDSNTISIASARAREAFRSLRLPRDICTTRAIRTSSLSPKTPLRSTKDLAGQIVGEPSLGGIVEVGISAGVDRSGGDWKAVKYVEIQASEAVPALEQGRIAATALQDPQLTESRSKIRILTPSYDAISKRYLSTVWFANAAWAKANPDVVRRFQLALNGGKSCGRSSIRTSPRTRSRSGSRSRLPRCISSTRTLDAGILQPLLDAAAKYGILPRQPSANDLIYAAPR